MKGCIITFPSMTYAISGQRTLSAAAISSNIIKLSSAESKNGCTQGLEIDPRYCENAAELLRRRGIKYGKVIT